MCAGDDGDSGAGAQCAVCSANTHRAGNPRTAGAEALEGTTNYQLLKGIRGCNLHTKPQPLCQ